MKSLHHFCAWCGKPVNTLMEHLNDPECIKITNQKKMALATNNPPWPTLEIAETGSFNGTCTSQFTGTNYIPDYGKIVDTNLGPNNGWGYGTTGPLDKPKITNKEALKLDTGKTDWSLMPWEAVEEINKVLDFGAKKYNEGKQGKEHWNWAKKPGLGNIRVLNAVFRHLFAYAKGEKLDPESGLSHVAHAACGLLFILYYSKYPESYTI